MPPENTETEKYWDRKIFSIFLSNYKKIMENLLNQMEFKILISGYIWKYVGTDKHLIWLKFRYKSKLMIY